MPTLEQLRKKSQAASSALWEAEQRERDKTNRAAIGKTFKYHNSYSGEDRWWLYLKVVGVKKGAMVCFQFQTDNNGQITIEPTNSRLQLSGGYVPIPEAEYNSAWAATLNKINSY